MDRVDAIDMIFEWVSMQCELYVCSLYAVCMLLV